MAFENGYKAINYIKNLIDKYNEDSMVFMKALQVYNTYKLQSTWPHNYKSLNESLSLLFGVDHEMVLKFTSQYLFLENQRRALLNSNEIEWPENASEIFINELTIYYNLIHQGIEQAAIARIKPLKFAGLTRSQLPMSRTKMLKLIRMDGESFEFEVDRSDVQTIMRSLGIMISDSCEINDEV